MDPRLPFLDYRAEFTRCPVAGGHWCTQHRSPLLLLSHPLHTLLRTLHDTLWAYHIICRCSARTRCPIESSVPSPMLSVSDSTRPFSLHHYHLPLRSLLLTYLDTHTHTNFLKNHLQLNQEGWWVVHADLQM